MTINFLIKEKGLQMSINHKSFTTAEHNAIREAQTHLFANHQNRLLNRAKATTSSPAEIIGRMDYSLYQNRLLNGTKHTVTPQKKLNGSATIIGRTGYPLYRPQLVMGLTVQGRPGRR